MNKTVERLIFMIIGALLVSIAYFVGNTDKTAEAQQTTFDDVRIKGTLIVDEIIVASGSKNFITLTAKDNFSMIGLTYGSKGDGTADAQIILSARKGDPTPISVISVSDNTRGTIYATSEQASWIRK